MTPSSAAVTGSSTDHTSEVPVLGARADAVADDLDRYRVATEWDDGEDTGRDAWELTGRG